MSAAENRPGGSIGHRVVRLEKTESTNTLVLETPDYLEHHGTVVRARTQTAGRGTRGHGWASLPGTQLLFSVVLHPTLPPEEFPILSLLAGVAVGEAIETVTGLQPRLKWPNDILIGGRKVCGILVEARSGPEGKPRVVLGIGVNCQGSPREFPVELHDIVTTLSHAAGHTVELEPVFEEILTRLESWYTRTAGGDRAGLIQAWSRMGLLKGQRVRVDSEEGMVECAPIGLTAEGYLLLEAENGERFVQVSSDLEWLPPTS